MVDFPSSKRCLEILNEVGCSTEVINHCIAVRDIAVKIGSRTKADLDLVEAGALLHDIGRCKTHDILHAIEGVKLAKKIGLPVSIVLIIERHIGAGIPKEDTVKLGLPFKDHIPISLEEKIVAHADNLIDKNKFQPIKHEVEIARKKGLIKYAQRLLDLHKELSDICGIDLDKICTLKDK